MADALRAAIEDLRGGEKDQELYDAFGDNESESDEKGRAQFRANTISICEKFIRFCEGAPFVIG
jgi:hypothetical protein